VSADAGEIELEVRSLVAAALKLPAPAQAPIAREACAAWDSLKHVEIVFALEDRFGVQFDEDEFPRLDSTSAIADMVAARLGS